MANQVTLTFAGEPKSLETAFDRVGQSAKDMDSTVRESAGGFDRVGEAADEVDTKAMGFRDTLTGVQDTMKGVGDLAKGPSFEGFLTLGMGVGDLGSGFYNFLVPSMKSAVGWLKTTKVATVATEVAQRAAALGSKIWAGAQWVLNAALTANPIGLIVVGILLLVGVVILIAKKTDWFQRLWKAIWSKIGDPVKAAWAWIKSTSSKVFDWLTGLPGKLKTAFSKVKDFISAPYKAAFNLISRAWNSTVGKLSWTVPGWIPGIGGKSISVPKLPTFHTGGTVPGRPGEQVPIMALAGEEVVPRGQAGGGAMVLEVHSGGTRLDDLLVEILARAVRVRGGNVQLVLGSSRG
ncbi:MAG TPA: hypothetical protein VIQ30_00495 [Pseudonocardia sp.]